MAATVTSLRENDKQSTKMHITDIFATIFPAAHDKNVQLIALIAFKYQNLSHVAALFAFWQLVTRVWLSFLTEMQCNRCFTDYQYKALYV